MFPRSGSHVVSELPAGSASALPPCGRRAATAAARSRFSRETAPRPHGKECTALVRSGPSEQDPHPAAATAAEAAVAVAVAAGCQEEEKACLLPLPQPDACRGTRTAMLWLDPEDQVLAEGAYDSEEDPDGDNDDVSDSSSLAGAGNAATDGGSGSGAAAAAAAHSSGPGGSSDLRMDTCGSAPVAPPSAGTEPAPPSVGPSDMATAQQCSERATTPAAAGLSSAVSTSMDAGAGDGDGGGGSSNISQRHPTSDCPAAATAEATFQISDEAGCAGSGSSTAAGGERGDRGGGSSSSACVLTTRGPGDVGLEGGGAGGRAGTGDPTGPCSCEEEQDQLMTPIKRRCVEGGHAAASPSAPAAQEASTTCCCRYSRRKLPPGGRCGPLWEVVQLPEATPADLEAPRPVGQWAPRPLGPPSQRQPQPHASGATADIGTQPISPKAPPTPSEHSTQHLHLRPPQLSCDCVDGSPRRATTCGRSTAVDASVPPPDWRAADAGAHHCMPGPGAADAVAPSNAAHALRASTSHHAQVHAGGPGNGNGLASNHSHAPSSPPLPCKTNVLSAYCCPACSRYAGSRGFSGADKAVAAGGGGADATLVGTKGVALQTAQPRAEQSVAIFSAVSLREAGPKEMAAFPPPAPASPHVFTPASLLLPRDPWGAAAAPAMLPPTPQALSCRCKSCTATSAAAPLPRLSSKQMHHHLPYMPYLMHGRHVRGTAALVGARSRPMASSWEPGGGDLAGTAPPLPAAAAVVSYESPCSASPVAAAAAVAAAPSSPHRVLHVRHMAGPPLPSQSSLRRGTCSSSSAAAAATARACQPPANGCPTSGSSSSSNNNVSDPQWEHNSLAAGPALPVSHNSSITRDVEHQRHSQLCCSIRRQTSLLEMPSATHGECLLRPGGQSSYQPPRAPHAGPTRPLGATPSPTISSAAIITASAAGGRAAVVQQGPEADTSAGAGAAAVEPPAGVALLLDASAARTAAGGAGPGDQRSTEPQRHEHPQLQHCHPQKMFSALWPERLEQLHQRQQMHGRMSSQGSSACSPRASSCPSAPEAAAAAAAVPGSRSHRSSPQIDAEGQPAAAAAAKAHAVILPPRQQQQQQQYRGQAQRQPAPLPRQHSQPGRVEEQPGPCLFGHVEYTARFSDPAAVAVAVPLQPPPPPPLLWEDDTHTGSRINPNSSTGKSVQTFPDTGSLTIQLKPSTALSMTWPKVGHGLLHQQQGCSPPCSPASGHFVASTDGCGVAAACGGGSGCYVPGGVPRVQTRLLLHGSVPRRAHPPPSVAAMPPPSSPQSQQQPQQHGQQPSTCHGHDVRSQVFLPGSSPAGAPMHVRGWGPGCHPTNDGMQRGTDEPVAAAALVSTAPPPPSCACPQCRARSPPQPPPSAGPRPAWVSRS